MSLQRYHLSKKNDEWRLEKAGSNRAVAKADTKENAILEMRGYMETHEGYVRIHKVNGRIVIIRQSFLDRWQALYERCSIAAWGW